MKISFVIPCYRSEDTLEIVVSELRSVLSERPEVDYEFVLVSDHSPDKVWDVIKRLHAEDPKRIKGLELARNFGQHAALMAGYARAAGDYIVSIDDDGQTPVESIWKLIEKIEADGFDVVYGAYRVKMHNVFRNVGSRINDLMARWLLGKPRDLQVTSFFVARRFVILEMLRYLAPFPYVIGLVLRVTRNIGSVLVDHRERREGASGYTFVKLVGLWFNGFTSFSVKPLRIASYAGFLCSLLGFGFGVWAVLNKLFISPNAPLGYSSLMAAVLFIGGVLMLLLGMIGEYVGRIFISINQSPQYVIREELGA